MRYLLVALVYLFLVVSVAKKCRKVESLVDNSERICKDCVFDGYILSYDSMCK